MKKKGFTLVELLVVIAMMGILLAISVPGFVQSVNKSKEMERVKHEEMINTC
ncbi:MAG: type II secretion system protein [Bacilli bacterium]